MAEQQQDPQHSPQGEDLWNQFQKARSDQDFYQGWLALQAGFIGNAVFGQLLVRHGENRFAVIAKWPDNKIEDKVLQELAERVIAEGCGLLIQKDEVERFALAYPLLLEDAVTAVVTFDVRAAAELELQQSMQQLQWGTSWLELLVRRRRMEDDRHLLTRLQTGVDILAVCLGEKSFLGAAMVLATETAAATGCERVSIGMRQGQHLRLFAVSNSSEVDRKMTLARLIEGAMEEAVFQQTIISYPAMGDTGDIYREHEALSRQQTMACVITLPLTLDNEVVGAMTCERAADRAFTQKDRDFLKGIAGLSGPALITRFDNDQSLFTKIRRSAMDTLGVMFGSSHLAVKLFVVCLIVLLYSLLTLQITYRLSADTVLEGAVQRAVVVPFNGYINEAPKRAGDLVRQGETLCTLDSRDLTLEKVGAYSKYRQIEQQYQDAMAQHDRATAGILKARLAQSQSELDLLDARLARTRLTAPFDGLIVSGDLSQRLGSAVEQGDIVFQITPLNEYRVILKIDERRITDVAVDQHGTLVLSSLPSQRYPFVVTKMTPFTVAREGRNYFRVEARLERIDNSIRPGMDGVGKIEIDERQAITVWTRGFLDWLRLTVWKWTP